MDQRKYLVYAVLLLLVIAGAYFAVQKLSQTKVVEDNSARHIDYDEPVDSLPKQLSVGKKLFQPCTPCHHLFKNGTGPALVGVNERWPDKKELFAFIRNPALVISRNTYAKKLKAEYGSMMVAYPDITDKEIQLILDYIKTSTRR